MSTSSLRLVAASVAVIVAVLTGIVTGMVGGETCTPSDQSPGPRQPTPGGQTGNATPTAPGGGLPNQPTPTLGTRQVRSEPVAADGETCSRSFSAPAALIGFLGAGLAGAFGTTLLFVRRRDDDTGSTATGSPRRSSDGSGDKRLERTEKDRATLVQTCIYVRDRATSKALADRLGWALQEVGVSTVSPTGARFDPAQHEAGGAMSTRESGKAGTIAAVEVPGYTDRGVVLRAPVVTVYREDGK